MDDVPASDDVVCQINNTPNIQSWVMIDNIPNHQADDVPGIDDAHRQVNNIPNNNSSMIDNTSNYQSHQPNIVKDIGNCKINGEIRKGNKKKDFCIYCEEFVLNFARHIERNHAIEFEVQKICSLPKGSKNRKSLLTLLRKRGNYLNVNETKKPMRTPLLGGDLLPCSGCLGLYSTKLLWRHRKKCLEVNDRRHQASGQNLLLKNLDIDPQLKEEVFPRMRADKISLIAKKDPLICAFATRYIRTHRERHFALVASRKMRELARLMMEIKKELPAIKNLFEVLTPKHFDRIVAATKIISKFDAEKDLYEAPTLALNMGTTLKQCCDIAIVFVLKRKSVYSTTSAAEAEADIRSMIHLIETNWRYEIASKAVGDLNMNKWNKITLVPLASDLKLLKEHLIAVANEAVQAIETNNYDKDAYLSLLETIFCRVILLNRRRPGELQRLPLNIYEKTEKDDDNQRYEEFSDVVTPSEKILMKTLKRVVIRGKRGRGVPVLFSVDVQDHIKILLNCRKNVFTKTNIYLFGNPKTTEPLCGYKILKKYAISSGAKNPNAITSTRLRKHLATLTQLFNMTEADIEQLANFMGHTVGVHRGSYRLPDDVYQTAKISKLLLLMEKGANIEFKGKPIEEIEVDLNENLFEKYNNDNVQMEDIQNITEDITENLTEDITEHITEDNNNVDSHKNLNKKRKRILVPWTDEQKKIVCNYFAKHIKEKIPPKKLECIEVKTLNPVLDNKDWLKIKVYVQNLYTHHKKFR